MVDSLTKIPGALAEYASRTASDGYLELEKSVKASLSNPINVITKAQDSVEDLKASATQTLTPDTATTGSYDEVLPQKTNITPNSVLGATENVLKTFASFNYNITLACLSTNELNFPESTYRNGGTPEVTVLRSGGEGSGTTKALIADETSTAKLEYFIDEVEMQAIIAPIFFFKQKTAYEIGQ